LGEKGANVARIRTIKPDFWTDAAIIECSTNARLLFVGALNFADDFGNLDRSAKQLKAQIFPADDIDCEPLIRQLLKHGLHLEYVVDGKMYLHIHNFTKHQKIDRPGPARFPEFKDSLIVRRTFDEHSTNDRRAFVPGREGKGREKESERASTVLISPPAALCADPRALEIQGEPQNPKPNGKPAAYAAELIRRGVVISERNEYLLAWIAAGNTLPFIVECVEDIRASGKTDNIVAKYLDKKVRDPNNARATAAQESPSGVPFGKIRCSVCGDIVGSHTNGKCDDCYFGRKLAPAPAGKTQVTKEN
jgi:hypothetical protein